MRAMIGAFVSVSTPTMFQADEPKCVRMINVEDDHRKTRSTIVAGPGEHQIDPAPMVSGGEAEQAAERRRAEDRPAGR